MRVLLFGFDPGGTSEHRPDRVRAHSVCYVGTHDNAPAAAWAALGGADADYAMRCLGVYDVARLPEALLRAGMGSRAELFVAQMQDVLGLGAESRMNTPGTAGRQLGLAAAARSGGRTGGCTPACTHTGGLPRLTGKMKQRTPKKTVPAAFFLPVRQRRRVPAQ